MTEANKLLEQQTIAAQSSLERVVPKFCTAISMAFLNNKNLVLTLLYTENDQAALIDRIVIDKEHAKSLHASLGKILEDEGHAE